MLPTLKPTINKWKDIQVEKLLEKDYLRPKLTWKFFGNSMHCKINKF